MDVSGIDLFQLMQQRLAWADRRQGLLAQNIANANTPGYRSRDLAPFASNLASAGTNAAQLLVTSPSHLAGPKGGVGQSANKPQQVSINGNGISMEQELGRVADTSAIQEMTINLERRYSSMFRIAYGRGG